MASGGRRGAGERVLESKHVIGLFLLMLVFSGVFFSLGYVMGRNQYDGQVRAAGGAIGQPESMLNARPDVAPKKTANNANTPSDSGESDLAVSSPTGSAWKFEENSKPAKAAPHLEPVPKVLSAPPPSKSVNARSVGATAGPASRSAASRTAVSASAIPSGSLVLQVAALAKQDDAVALASSLQKRHFAAYVQKPQRDRFYRVQVGPFKDQKSADEAKKGLESAGFKAFYVKH